MARRLGLCFSGTSRFAPPTSAILGGERRVLSFPDDQELAFDVIVESSRVGLRKPDPRIYELTLDRLGVAATHAVFLDDLGINLKPARQLGVKKVLPKPFTRKELLAAVRESLAA